MKVNIGRGVIERDKHEHAKLSQPGGKWVWTISGPIYESAQNAKASKNTVATDKMKPLNKLALKLRIKKKTWPDIRNNDEVKKLIKRDHPEYKDLAPAAKKKFWANVRGSVNKVLRK